ncbi:TetR/AcrR family transcriptional regulator [Robiginitalea sp. M366]|uniref:TetR/AcrR family transcriptional regulator n=1 Tax=Robiginitalea aestuariiviva TaxID=3036903 RepID=UPI00240CECB0|nr:TetR/AcrR family transcriptional regulator [Robiginitalea aestuariiviva]MDG1573113.1 TetR/AcrR family transcriptional regulator [Robiginitalea aestuariiviva]
MTTKAQRTTAYIIETVAPIFNRQGYVGTSMSDLTQATGLTKGALYGNFENKDALALAAFQHNSTRLLSGLDQAVQEGSDARQRLAALMDFYRHYDRFTHDMGGCPVLNVGIDAQFNHRTLAAAARETAQTIEGKIALLLEDGVKAGEFRLAVPPLQFAKQLYTMIQGAVAMATLAADRKYLHNTITYLELLLSRELKPV